MIKTIILITAMAGAVLLLLLVFQRNLLFPKPLGKLPTTLPPHVEKIDLNEGYALFVRSDLGSNPQKPLVFFSHGNAELAFWSIEPMAYFNDLGFHVLLYEYPGYGGAEGSPSRDSIERAAIEAYDKIISRPEVDPKKMIIYGRSIGGGAATVLASHRPAAALILESTFSALSTLVAEKGMPSFLLRDRFDNEAIVADLQIPIFLYHGSEDRLIPIEHSLRLKSAAQNATLVTAPCGHNNCPRPWAQLEPFLMAHGLLEANN
ncbi:MAG: alpha/beta hydrolase [Pseudomonadales bacterium]